MTKAEQKQKLAEDIELHVQLPSGSHEIMIANPDDTVEELKSSIKRKFNIQIPEQFLYFKKDALLDGFSLSMYGLIDGSTIRVTKRKQRWLANNIRPRHDQASYKDFHSRRSDYDIDPESYRMSGVDKFRKAIAAVGCVRVMDFSSSKSRKTVLAERGVNDKIPTLLYEDRVKEAKVGLIKPLRERSPSDLDHIVLWLQTLSRFAQNGVTEESLRRVSRKVKLVSVEAGSYVFQQGDMGSEFYAVMRGSISLAIHNYGKVGTLGEGCVFGEIAVLNEGTGCLRTATALADFETSHVDLAVFPKCAEARELLAQLEEILRSKIKFLNSIPYFHDLPKSSLMRLAYVSTTRSVSGKTKLIEQGEESTHMYILMHGQVTMSRSRHGEKCVAVLDLIEPPQLFGEECCGEDRSFYSATVTSVSSATVLEIPTHCVNHIISPFKSALEMIIEAAESRAHRHKQRLHMASRLIDETHSNAKKALADAQLIPNAAMKDINLSIGRAMDVPIPLITFPNSGISINAPSLSCTRKTHSRPYLLRLATTDPHRQLSPRLKRIQALAKIRQDAQSHHDLHMHHMHAVYPLTHLQV